MGFFGKTLKFFVEAIDRAGQRRLQDNVFGKLYCRKIIYRLAKYHKDGGIYIKENKHDILRGEELQNNAPQRWEVCSN